MNFIETKFKTFDSVELHGRVYASATPGPGVVMCPGFNCVLTMLNLPTCAEALQKDGFTVLLYDPRSTGFSGGEPRNDIDPHQAISDLSDALTHLQSLPSVDDSRTGVFGFSFGGAVALSCASVDPRCRFSIAVAPLTDMDFSSPEQRTRVLSMCARDRASQIMGNPGLKVPMVNSRGENPVGFGHGIDKSRYADLIKHGREIAPGHINGVTLMTYYRLALWTPWQLWKYLSSGDYEKGLKRGTMFIIPGNDSMSYPELQRKFFAEIQETSLFTKTKLELSGVGHEDALGEDQVKYVMASVSTFIQGLLAT